MYNTTPVCVCTKSIIGAHYPRCTVCTRLTRKGFNDLERSTARMPKRKRFQTPDRQQKNPPPNTPDDTTPLIEYHIHLGEDDIQD